MATRSVGEQIQLLFLDSVFHLAALAVEIVVEFLRIAGQVGHHKSGVGALVEMLGLDEMKSFAKKKKLTSAMRRVAPIGLSTTIGVSMNFRALRHIAEMRTSIHAEAEVREVLDQVMDIAKVRWPNLLSDFTKNEEGEWVPGSSKV